MVNKKFFAEKISDYLDRSIGYVCIIFAAIMTISTLTGILFRYVMTNPLTWTEELARYTMIWMGLLAISLGVKRDEHLGVKLFVNLLPQFFQIFLKYSIRILIGMFLSFLLVYGYKMSASGVRQTSPALGMKMVFVLSAVPFTAGLSLLQLLLLTITDIRQGVITWRQRKR